VQTEFLLEDTGAISSGGTRNRKFLFRRDLFSAGGRVPKSSGSDRRTGAVRNCGRVVVLRNVLWMARKFGTPRVEIFARNCSSAAVRRSQGATDDPAATMQRLARPLESLEISPLRGEGLILLITGALFHGRDQRFAECLLSY